MGGGFILRNPVSLGPVKAGETRERDGDEGEETDLEMGHRLRLSDSSAPTSLRQWPCLVGAEGFVSRAMVAVCPSSHCHTAYGREQAAIVLFGLTCGRILCFPLGQSKESQGLLLSR